MSTRRRALLGSVPVAVLGAAASLWLKSWWQRRPAETCPGHQHPRIQSARLVPGPWERTDEWYHYRAQPRVGETRAGD